MTKKTIKPKQPKIARLTITLENYAGIKRQKWVGTPKSFAIDWPIDSMSILGERMAMLIREPNEIEMRATMTYLGNTYRSDHSK